MSSIAESDVVDVLAGPLAGLAGLVRRAEAGRALVHCAGLEPAWVALEDLRVAEPVRLKTYREVLEDIEAAVLDAKEEPSDEQLAALEAALHGPLRSTIASAKPDTGQDPGR